jgi:hypothetical protein
VIWVFLSRWGMKPYQAARSLRHIASKIQNSKNPDRKLVAKDLKCVLAALGQQIIYRVITDEPQGICVGFKPSDAALAQVNAEIDEWTLVGDDGSDGIPFLVDPLNANGVAISNISIVEGIQKGWSPLGMDMSVWRSEQEMIDDLGF